MADPLIVFGAGGHAKVVIEAATARWPGREIVILDDAPERVNLTIFGIPVTGGRDRLQSMRKVPVIAAIGDNHARAALLAWLRSEGHAAETVVHPAAVVASSVELGPGAFISAGAVVIAGARIGAGTIVNTMASVDHDCTVGESAHIGPGAHLCGNVSVGRRVLVGVGTSIGPGISICDDVIVGAGSVVIRSVCTAGTIVGNPARRLR